MVVAFIDIKYDWELAVLYDFFNNKFFGCLIWEGGIGGKTQAKVCFWYNLNKVKQKMFIKTQLQGC